MGSADAGAVFPGDGSAAAGWLFGSGVAAISATKTMMQKIRFIVTSPFKATEFLPESSKKTYCLSMGG
jgi:hypothetical protein